MTVLLLDVLQVNFQAIPTNRSLGDLSTDHLFGPV